MMKIARLTAFLGAVLLLSGCVVIVNFTNYEGAYDCLLTRKYGAGNYHARLTILHDPADAPSRRVEARITFDDPPYSLSLTGTISESYRDDSWLNLENPGFEADLTTGPGDLRFSRFNGEFSLYYHAAPVLALPNGIYYIEGRRTS